MSIDNINTQNNIHGSLHIWVTAHLGEPLDALSGISPMYLSTIYSELTVSLFFYRHPIMTDYAFFYQGSDRWGKEMALLWESLTIYPPLQQFHIPSLTPAELSSLTSLKAWGEKQKICHNITFLLVLAEEEATRVRKYSLLTIWVGEPLSGRVCSIEEAVGELTT